jgi:glycosyltransferase 2 family protein
MNSTVLARPAGSIEFQGIQPERRARDALFLTIKIGFSALAGATIYYSVDFSAAWHRASSLDARFILAAAMIMMFQIACGGLRWKYILARLGTPLATAEALRLFYISAFFNTCSWGAVSGDIIRVWFSYRARIKAADCVHSVILDRVAAAAGVAILVLATVPWLGARVGYNLPLVFSMAIAIAGLMGIAVVAQLEHLPQTWRRLRLVRLVQDLGGATRRVLLKPGAISVFAMAIIAQTAMALATYILALGLRVEVGLIACLALMQPVALLAALPISIGGWGVREAAMIGLFALVGVPAHAALLLSVSLGLLAILVSLPGAVIWALRLASFRGRRTRGDAFSVAINAKPSLEVKQSAL